MAKKIQSITTSCSAKEVWSVLSKFDEISSWADNVDHSCYLTEQESGIGAVRRIQHGSNIIIETVTKWDDVSCLAYRLDGFPPVFRRITNSWQIHEEKSETFIELAVEIIPIRPPVEVVAKIVSHLIARVNKKMLSNFKNHLEQTAMKDR